MSRRKKAGPEGRKPEAGEQTKIPVSGDLWQRAKGAAMYLAIVAYPAPEEWPKRDRFLKAAQAWILKSCPRGWAKHLRKWRPRSIRMAMDKAFWRIESRRLPAAEMLRVILVCTMPFPGFKIAGPRTVNQAAEWIAGPRRKTRKIHDEGPVTPRENETRCQPCKDRGKNSLAMRMVDGTPMCVSCFRGKDPRVLKMNRNRLGNIKHRVWAETLSVIHLAMAIPGGPTWRNLIVDPSWVAKSLHNAEIYRRISAPFLGPRKAIEVRPS